MRNKALLIMIGTLAIVGSAQSDNGDDQVHASFDRALNHQAAPERLIQRDALATDPLYRLINSALWTAEVSEDPILASFLRNLHHDSVAQSNVSASEDPDELTEAFNGTLWTLN